MKRKYLGVALAALLIAAGLWLARSGGHTHSPRSSSLRAGVETPEAQPAQSDKLDRSGRPAPPDPLRRFRDFTPEQRVEFARRGHGPGG